MCVCVCVCVFIRNEESGLCLPISLLVDLLCRFIHTHTHTHAHTRTYTHACVHTQRDRQTNARTHTQRKIAGSRSGARCSRVWVSHGIASRTTFAASVCAVSPAAATCFRAPTLASSPPPPTGPPQKRLSRWSCSCRAVGNLMRHTEHWI